MYKISILLPRPLSSFFKRRSSTPNPPSPIPKKIECDCTMMPQNSEGVGEFSAPFDLGNEIWDYNWTMDPERNKKENEKYRTITYCMLNGTEELKPEDLPKQQRVINFVIRLWGLEIGWKFMKVKSTEKPDIKIWFIKDEKFIKKNGPLAITKMPGTPNQGEIQINDFYNWSLDGKHLIDERTGGLKTSYNMSHTLIHEIGHALGLAHSKNEGSIMFPKYNKEKLEISNNDRNNIQTIYGNRNWPSQTIKENVMELVKESLTNPSRFHRPA